MQEEIVFCRWSPTLGELEDTHEKIWGTKEYRNGYHNDAVFFGLYGLPDFYALWRHQGKRYILWAGSDITHFKNGYWLEDGGGIKIDPKPLAAWINRYCESWVENGVERTALAEMGIKAHITPSFLGDVKEFDISFKPSEGKPKLYTSVSGNDFELYGWNLIPDLALKNEGIEFHLYGNTADVPYETPENVIVHGRVPKEQMNREIKDMQGALRLTKFDGFSEILAKSILMGQWPVSLIPYPHMLQIADIPSLKHEKRPNFAGRKYYIDVLNNFPWNKKI